MNSQTMKDNLSDLRDIMHEMLGKCTEAQRDLFGRMYNHEGKFSRDVDALSPERIDNAFSQIERTLQENERWAEIMSNEKLAPCPFCGVDCPEWCDTGGGDWHHIQCRNCESCTGGYHKTREEAIADWNRRSCSDCERMRAALIEAKRLLTGPVMHGDGVMPCGGPGGCQIHDLVSAIDAALSVPSAPEGGEEKR